MAGWAPGPIVLMVGFETGWGEIDRGLVSPKEKLASDVCLVGRVGAVEGSSTLALNV